MAPKTPQARYIAYYRVSTREQGRSGLGIAAQKETVRAFLKGEGGGWPPLESYTEAESGKRNDRPELAKALASCRAHRATLVVAKVDRLARSQAFLERLVSSGAAVRFCDLPDLKGATGRFMLRQMASVAELEADFISERTKAALAARVATKGQWDRKAAHHLVPGAGQKAAAKRAAEGAAEHASDLRPVVESVRKDGASSLREIAAALTERGAATRRGGAWGPSAVRDLLMRLDG